MLTHKQCFYLRSPGTKNTLYLGADTSGCTPHAHDIVAKELRVIMDAGTVLIAGSMPLRVIRLVCHKPSFGYIQTIGDRFPKTQFRARCAFTNSGPSNRNRPKSFHAEMKRQGLYHRSRAHCTRLACPRITLCTKIATGFPVRSLGWPRSPLPVCVKTECFIGINPSEPGILC